MMIVQKKSDLIRFIVFHQIHTMIIYDYGMKIDKKLSLLEKEQALRE